MKAAASICCEISWEVCNKVGGIYTVVSSKAQRMVEHYGDGYYAIGPYSAQRAIGSFEEKLPPEHLKAGFERLQKEGIECHYGIWLIKGNPQAILIDITNFAKNANNIKKLIWDIYKIDTLGTQWNDVDEPLIWSWAAGKLVEQLAKSSIVCHCHEWLAGGALLYITLRKLPIGTVFTTHATVLGRALASEGVLYDVIDTVNADEEANKRGQGLKAKHQIEKQSALHARIFTTVSEITGIEAEKLLGRKPDLLLPNGLDMSTYPTFEEVSVRHKLTKGKLFDFIIASFFPFYSFDLNNTLVFFLAGRHEFHDKGIDIFIKALGKLNDRLVAEKSNKTIMTFFWVPGNVRAIKQPLLESKTYYRDLKEKITDDVDEIEHNLLHALIASQPVSEERLLNEELRAELKRKLLRFKRAGKPPVCTHDLNGDDEILQALAEAGLDNDANDRVKVMYYPIYLNGADGLLDMTYNEAMQGSHLGVFPSYYEPWGYTPLEAGALGVPSITTDLAGFGRFICNECAPGPNPGIWVLKRWKKTDDSVVEQLAETMHYYATRDKENRIDNKLAAREIANRADWKEFIERYIDAENRSIT